MQEKKPIAKCQVPVVSRKGKNNFVSRARTAPGKEMRCKSIPQSRSTARPGGEEKDMGIIVN